MALTTLVFSAVLAACAPTQVELQSAVNVPLAFEQAYGTEEMLLDRWWHSWDDPELIRLIELGLAHNRELSGAYAKLAQARGIARLAEADKGPQVGAGVDVMGAANRLSNPLSRPARHALSYLDQQGLVANDLSNKYLNLNAAALNAGVVASWEPDFFGHKQADADAARYGALAQAEQWHAAQLLLVADIADFYIQWRYYAEKKRLLQLQIQHLKQYQRYVKGRFAAGQATRYEVLSVASELDAAQSATATLDALQADSQRRLAVLTGQVPQAVDINPSSQPLAELSPPMPTGQTPAHALNRRPDVRAKQALVYVASAQLASAKADLLPRFRIDFMGSTGHVGLSSDFRDTQFLGGLVRAGIQLPIFTAGRIQANIESQDANTRAALADYDHTVLQALADVDSAYEAQFALRAQSQQLQQAARSSQSRVNAAQKLYRHGEITLNELLDAQLQLNQWRLQQLDVDLARNQAMLDLYKALGGGWQPDEAGH